MRAQKQIRTLWETELDSLYSEWLQRAPVEAQGAIIAAQADILLMEVSRLPAYTLENRLKLIECVRRALPNCKFVLLCDENSDSEQARRVMIARQDRLIDAFLYASVTPAYLTAALDAL